MPRHTRYEGAIIRDHELLLIRHLHHDDGRTYWLFPGGGLEAGESEEACLHREMLEETNLEVLVERVLLDLPTEPDAVYVRRKMYLCRPIAGTASPGYEPEADASAVYAIAETRWFDLRNPGAWDPQLLSDPITMPLVQRIRELLGYGATT
jgi:8-oxo-dGTP pyrophosphatase MutT (NUDIX family)